MKQALGAVAALAVLGVLLVGPLYVAISAADDGNGKYHCTADVGCETASAMQ